MLCSYDDYALAAIVFNHYGDIVYRNRRAGDLISGSHISSVSCNKIRLITASLINGLICSPFSFHAEMTPNQRFICHLHQHYSSYTLLLAHANQPDLKKPRPSLFGINSLTNSRSIAK